MERTGTLAKGCFGKVYKEKYNDKWAAIKRVPIGLISRKDLEREVEVYKKAEHPNIVKLLGPVTLKSGKYEIPMEFIFGEDLETTIFKVSKSKIPFTSNAKSTIILGMCEGLLHLHLRDIVHQDLKPDNVMVEHETNRAVIIDLGLAKFFKRGLNSAMDMGNEAYAAPEVLQQVSQRDQRSDVWAMGKIIAELCARVRLATPSVNPDKIKDTLKDSPYCRAVCRMVQPDPSLRATMPGVISAIRLAGAAKPAGTGGARHLTPPANPANPQQRSPSPMNRAGSPYDRARSPFHRDPSPFRDHINRSPSPRNWEPTPRPEVKPANPSPSPRNWERTPRPEVKPANPSPSPRNWEPTPRPEVKPANPSPSPRNWERTPRPEVKPANPSPLNWERTPRPDPKRPAPQVHIIQAPPRNQDKLAVVPKGGSAEITSDLMKMRLYQEVTKDLPCDLPTTGRVVVRRFEEKDGQMGTWEQREVVTRDGKIVQYNDVKMNSN